MEINGVYIDQTRLEALKDEVEPLLNEFESAIYNLAKRQFKITSPDQLAEVLYDDLRIPQAGGIRVDKTGKEIDEARSTKEALLARMRHPIAQQVLNYRTLFKLKTAFLTKLLSQVRAGKDGRIHPVYNTTVRTGRWSCKKPNVQQIPSKKKAQEYDQRILGLGPKLRSVFTAPSGKKFVGGDLSQIELRLAAHFTKDYNLLKVYSESQDFGGIRYYTGDIHDTTSKSLGVPRKIAKNINFGLVYGMSAKGFARYARLYKEGTDVFDIERAEAFRNGFMELYAGIPDFLDRLQKTREGQFIKTKFQTISGRFRRFPKEDNAFPGKIFNSIIQGSAADILKVIIWALDVCIVKNPKFAGTELVLQVHDEVGLYVPEEMVNRVAVLTKYIMEARWFEMEVPVLASVKICDDWGQKDDDSVPEVGILYTKLSDKGVVTDRIFTNNNWKEFADFEEAAKKDEKAKKPANESKIVLVKPCVAMLTDAQNRWAAQFVKVEDFTFHGDEGKFVKEE
jgi:DNA polymerase-1